MSQEKEESEGNQKVSGQVLSLLTACSGLFQMHEQLVCMMYSMFRNRIKKKMTRLVVFFYVWHLSS